MEYISSLLSSEGRSSNPYAAYFLYASMAIGAIKLTYAAMSLLAFTYRHTLKR
jgi:hypothetical protein